MGIYGLTLEADVRYINDTMSNRPHIKLIKLYPGVEIGLTVYSHGTRRGILLR